MLSIACVPLFGQTGLGSSTAVPLEPVVDREALAMTLSQSLVARWRASRKIPRFSKG